MSTTARNARATIRARTPFKTAGALSAWLVDTPYPATGQLTGVYRKIFMDLATATYYGSEELYAVFSYETPIAWFDPFTGQWVRPDVKYSPTTSRHQGQCPTTGTKED